MWKLLICSLCYVVSIITTVIDCISTELQILILEVRRFLKDCSRCNSLIGSRNKDPYSSKGPSLERSNYNKQSYDGRGSRSGSQHRSTERENSSSAAPKVAPTTISSAPKPAQTPVPVYTMTEEQLERHVKNNLDEYLNDSCTIDEYSQDTQATVPPSYFPRIVADG